jgi:hypothetical protein
MAMRAFPLVAAALLVSACQTAGVRTDFDPAANFTAYRTYNWVPSDVPRGMNPLMFRRVKDSIDRSLAARGYVQANPGDFAISFTIDERDRIRADDYGYGWPYGGYGGYGWGGYGWGGWGGWGYPGVDIYTVTQRSIVIDVYDARTRAPAWHGVVRRDSYSDRVDYARLDRAVAAVLAQFPPQPGARTSSAY